MTSEFTYDPDAFTFDARRGGRPSGPPIAYVREAYASGAIDDADLDAEIERALTTRDARSIAWDHRGRPAFKAQGVRM